MSDKLVTLYGLAEYNSKLEVKIQSQLAGYALSGHTHDYLSTSGGTITGNLKVHRNTGVSEIDIYDTSGNFSCIQRWHNRLELGADSAHCM